MKIVRRFTATGQNAYQGMAFSPRPLPSLDDDSAPLPFTAPDNWSLIAVSALAELAYSSAVPAATKAVSDPRTPLWLCPKQADHAMIATYPMDERTVFERDARQVFDRMAGFWTYHGWQAGFFDTESDARAYYDEMRYMLAAQMAAPEASQWREAGIHWAYGLTNSSNTLWTINPATGEIEPSKNSFANPTSSPVSRSYCDLSAEHSYEFMTRRATDEHKLAALVTGSRALTSHSEAILQACSNGYESDNIHRLDPEKNVALAKCLYRAKQAGLPDNVLINLLAIARQGITTLPQLPEYDLDWDNVAYRDLSIDGQGRVLGVATAEIGTHESWEDLAKAIWQSAEPVVEFTTTKQEWQTISNLHDSEAPAATLNLARFRNLGSGHFDIDGFTHATRLWTLTLEIIGQCRGYESFDSAAHAYHERPLALSFGNSRGFLTANGLVQDSPVAATTLSAIAALMTGQAYATSAELAGEMGAFPCYIENGANMLRVLENQRTALYGKAEGYHGLTQLPINFDANECRDADLAAAARMVWDQAVEQGRRHGFRNAAVTALKATNNIISNMMEMAGGGAYGTPAFITAKTLPEGGLIKTFAPMVPEALSALGYGESEMADIRDHALGHATLKGAPFINFETLRDRGFDDATLAKLEGALAEAADLRFVFTKWVVGEKFCTGRLGIPQDALNDYSFDLLGYLGFLPSEVDAANRWCCGTGTLVDAPHLRDAHRTIFTAPSPESEIRLMAALQPFISGEVLATLHLPASVDIREVDQLLKLAATLGLKNIGLYRDGARLAQRQALDLPETAMAEEQPAQPTTITVYETITTPAPHQAGREFLPDRRHGYTLRSVVEGQEILLRTAQYADGRLGEVTIDLPGAESTLTGPVQQVVAALTLALQYGIPLDEFIETVNSVRTQGRAAAIISVVLAELKASYGAPVLEVKQDNAPVGKAEKLRHAEEPSIVL